MRLVALTFLIIALAACGSDSKDKKPSTKSSALEGAGIDVPDGANEGGPRLTVAVETTTLVTSLPATGDDSKVAGLGPAVSFGPGGTSFAKPVTIKLPFAAADYNDAALVNKAFVIVVREEGASEAAFLGEPVPWPVVDDDDVDPLGYQIGPIGIVPNGDSSKYGLVAKVEVSHFTTYQVCVIGTPTGETVEPADTGDDTGVGIPDECEFADDGVPCSPSEECTPTASCNGGVCIPTPTPAAVDPGGVIKPEDGGAPADGTQFPGWMNLVTAGFIGQGPLVGFIMDTLAEIPADLPPEITFAEFMLLLYGPGIGAPATPHPPWEAATHRLVVRQDATTYPDWTGLVLQYDAEAEQWVVISESLEFERVANSVSIFTEIPGIDGCVPYKYFSEVRKDGVLYWKALTNGNPASDPNGLPFNL